MGLKLHWTWRVADLKSKSKVRVNTRLQTNMFFFRLFSRLLRNPVSNTIFEYKTFLVGLCAQKSRCFCRWHLLLNNAKMARTKHISKTHFYHTWKKLNYYAPSSLAVLVWCSTKTEKSEPDRERVLCVGWACNITARPFHTSTYFFS